MVTAFRKKLLFLFLATLVFTILFCWFRREGMLKHLAVVNVLDKQYYDDCRIKGSIHIPLSAIKDFETKVDKNATVVTYCTNYMCRASKAARDRLLTMGYKNVYVYEGGTAEWKKKGFPVEGVCKKSYLNMVGTPPEKKEPYMLTAEELKAKIDAVSVEKNK